MYDTTMPYLSSNQNRIGYSCYESQQQASSLLQPQSFSCSPQIQQRSVTAMQPFFRPDCIPLSCIPTADTPFFSCSSNERKCFCNVPRTVCVDFGKYGLEAMKFQEKFRKSSANFTVDENIEIKDHNICEKGIIGCSETCSLLLSRDQKQELFRNTDKVNCKQNPQKYPYYTSRTNKNKSLCFPEPNSDKHENAKTLIIGKRKKKNHTSRESYPEENLFYNCFHEGTKQNYDNMSCCFDEYLKYTNEFWKNIRL